MRPFPRLASALRAARAPAAAVALSAALIACGPAEVTGEPDGGADAGEPDPCAVDLPPELGLVLTDLGPVRGELDGTVWAYKGVPFAAPPVGDLRWRPPEPLQCWTTPLQAAAFPPRCPQDASGTVVGDEDCLYLNVWAPADGAEGRPVLFYVHGGGNVQGSTGETNGGVAIYDGAALAKETGSVVVTAQYRLGALGFLTHPDLTAESAHGSSGNYGLLDQLAALRWTQRNAEAFGGDPERVLLFGESAGAIDAAALLASPLADGLFSAVALQSGYYEAPSFAPLSQREQIDTARAAAAGCPDDGTAALCLRALSAEEVVRAIPGEVLGGVEDGFGPAVDGWVLHGAPLEVVAAGEHNRVPFIVGANADEMSVFVGQVPSEAAYEQAVEDAVGPTLAPVVLGQYPVADYGSPRAALVALMSDATFICPARRLARAGAAGQSAPVYRYHFTHRLSGLAGGLGAFHGLDVLFLFQHLTVQGYSPSPAEQGLADAMAGYWAGLAADGVPAGAVGWPAYEADTDLHLVLGTQPATAEGVRTEQCDFWDGLQLP